MRRHIKIPNPEHLPPSRNAGLRAYRPNPILPLYGGGSRWGRVWYGPLTVALSRHGRGGIFNFHFWSLIIGHYLELGI